MLPAAQPSPEDLVCLSGTTVGVKDCLVNSLAALPYLAYEQLTKQTADTGNTLLTYLRLKINNTVLSWIVRVLGNKQIFNKVVFCKYMYVCSRVTFVG